jgi:hypothetical protein
MTTPNPAIPNIDNTPDVQVALSSRPAQPLVLFPVRLETRFFALADGSSELRVRVYPDKIHMDAHEPALTADELTWGQHFWEQTWRAGDDQEREKTAWRQLADRFEPPRAAWIARALKPLNPEARPASPVAADQPLPKPPQFPAPATKAAAWTRAPATRALPNQWIVLGYKDGRLVINVKGASIPDTLPTGPDPTVSAASTPANPEQLGIDAGMQWMVDFDAAEKVGMGIRAKLASVDAAAGLDIVLVMGIKDSPDAAAGWAPRLAELFDAHHYTDGLSFVAQGTPSNNTADAPSGFSSKDPGYEASYQAERSAPAFQPSDGSNADLLTTALGLASAGPVFANLPNATAREQQDARQMNTVLWQATWGYFMSQMLGVGAAGESPLTDEDIAWARRHFIDYVRASGPLPAVRAGKQPYGVLPVTSLSAWKPPAGQQSQYARDTQLRDFLLRMRDIWRRSYPQVPRLGRSANLDSDMADVLSMEGLSSSYSIRNLMGRHYLEHLWVLLGAEFFFFHLGVSWQPQPRAAITLQQFHAWFAAQEQLTAPLLNTLGLSWRPRLARGVFAPPSANLRGALVQAGPAAPNAALAPNYIESLLAARDLIGDVRDAKNQQLPPYSLLYLLLRHSMLLEYAEAGSRLLIKRGLLPPALCREPELVDLPVGQQTQTVWRQLGTNISVPGVADPIELGKYLLGFTPSGEPDLANEPDLKPLSEFRASLAQLQSLSVGRLEQLLSGTLDLCSHRLDAWITSFATKRLAEMRTASPAGVLIGGYGWVINLKPAVAQTKVAAPPGEQDPIFQSASNPGFIHTPSLAQATTAAVLRSGHLAHSGQQTPDDLLAIDLSSARVRLAAWLLDGVRQGQPLGALLGYRFERRLQEAGKSQFITYFREVAPLIARKLEQTDLPVESIAANNVVDGLALNRQWQAAHKQPPPPGAGYLSLLFAALKNQPPLGDLLSARGVLEAELSALTDSVDAVSDALMAESVHQTVRGNPLRAASTAESIAGGEAPPPELDVVQTPRSGIALTHRLVTLISGEPALPPAWPPPAHPLRANAEPHLNAWAAKLLGDPTRVRCEVERLEPATGAVLDSRELRLDQLGLAPLDFIYAVEGGQGGQLAEIEQRILHAIMRRPDGFAPGALLRVSPSRQPDWAAGDIGYGEFNTLLRAARKLIAGARAIDADDLNLPEQSANFSVDVAELEQRAADAEQGLRQTQNDFQPPLAAPDTAALDVVRELIMRAASFGMPGAVPLSAAGELPADRQALLAQAASIQKEQAQRATQLAALASGFDAGTGTLESRRDYALARLRTVLGKAFVVLPRFTAANAAELEQALANSTNIQDGDALAAATWFLRMARVREGVARLNATLQYAEALSTGERLKLTIAQLPYSASDRWVGSPLKAGQQLPGGKLSLVVQSAAPLDVRQPLVGLLIDEWVEVVPSPTETTGIALQYDQPNAAPPQTILLAVPPEIEAPWTIWSLQQVLLETLDLARIRAVDPDALGEVGHFLPALYLACNTINDGAVSTDFTTIK